MTTPFKAGEPDAFGYEARDSLLTVQGFAPKEATDRRKQQPASVTHFSELIGRSASAQAQYFLNVYFDNISAADKKRVYDEWQIFKVIQKEASLAEDSPSIAQNLANLFLQRLGRTMTPTEFKEEFKSVDSNFDGKMAFLEYLCWDFKLGSPAHAVYRPQVQGGSLSSAISKVISCERALRAYDDDLAAKTAAANELTGVKGTRAKQELNNFKENTNLSQLNGDLSSAQDKLIKARGPLTERGTEFWEATVAAEAQSRLSQRAQK
jgi:hypothetical protein